MDEKDLKNETSESPMPNAEFEKLKAERDEYLNGWKRAKADLINFQKEESKRLADTVKYGNEKILLEVIRTLDSFSLALSVLEKSGGADKGLYLIKSQMEDLLKRNGVEKIAITPGEDLDTGKHEAVMMVDPTENLKSGMVAEEVETGYILNGKVLRPAKVKVVK